MSSHSDRFDELVISIEAVGDVMDEARRMTILLGSLLEDYDTIVSIIENAPITSLLDIKEKLLKAHEKMRNKETLEGAFRVKQHGKKGYFRAQSSEKKQPKTNECRGKCSRCHQFGHKRQDCPRSSKSGINDSETAFKARNDLYDGWLLDSGASSHMTPTQDDFYDYKHLSQPVE